MRNALAAAGFLLLFVAIPSFGVAADTPSPATAGGEAVTPDGAKDGKSPGPAPVTTAVPPPAPAPSVPAQSLHAPA
ncbi:MAG TPA: hypothetical protein VHM68_03565, partial [Candidatus Deferrimicrobium sp.]|nr:hypothetical protein [Candidatus Deferrimicrobium sp.]